MEALSRHIMKRLRLPVLVKNRGMGGSKRKRKEKAFTYWGGGGSVPVERGMNAVLLALDAVLLELLNSRLDLGRLFLGLALVHDGLDTRHSVVEIARSGLPGLVDRSDEKTNEHRYISSSGLL